MISSLQGGVQVPTGGNHNVQYCMAEFVRAREPKGRIPVRFRGRRYSPDGRREHIYYQNTFLLTYKDASVFIGVYNPGIDCDKQ